jgi:hypothetical protein
MAGERYRHIFLAGPTRTQGFTNPRGGGSEPSIPGRDRAGHSQYLQRRLDQAWREFKQQIQRQAVVHVERQGAYIEFIGEPGFDLMIKSLEALRSGIRLYNVRKEGEGESERTLATVYVPHNKRGHFLRRIEAYKDPKPGKRTYNDLINSISNIKLAVLESFWRSDERFLIPGDSPEWVEVWLASDKAEVVSGFEALLESLNLQSAEGSIKFPERSVKLILANRSQLEQIIESSDEIAELRAAKEVATFYIQLENREQLELVQGLLGRCSFDDATDVVVCILDTGVNNGHMLLQPVLNDDDLHTAKEEWGTNDQEGHGTLMAGTATYGDLVDLLDNSEKVSILHRLESAKILPPPPAVNPKELWGYFMAQGVSRAEIEAPERKRILCMAITATDDRDRGRPSSWSGMVDELTSGYLDDKQRLILIQSYK